jgi:alpha-2-macroglobulin
VLRALVRAAGGKGQPSAIVANATRWLMTVRSNGRWETTQENAWAILALTDYMVATGELNADYTYALLLNGANLASGTVSAANVDQPIRAQVPVSQLRPQADNDIIMTRTATAAQKGTGKLYYSAFLRYFMPAENIKPLNRGLIVDRQVFLASDPKKPVTQAKVNDLLTVKLTIIAPYQRHYVVVEDPLPAGCEAVDTSLRTTSSAVENPRLTSAQAQERLSWYWYWFSHTELRDEKVALFATGLPAGTYEYTYTVRCTTPGQYIVLPATAYEMYFADVFGRSAGGVFTIGE